MSLNRLIRAVRRRTAVPPSTLASNDAYALWAASYSPTAHNQLMQIEQAAMLALMPSLAGRDVLDLACGTGRYALIARKADARRVIGIDSSAAMLKAGWGFTSPPSRGVLSEFGERESASSVKLALSNMDAIPFAAASFDVILCGLATGHLLPERMRASLHEMARILRRGGAALISDFHPFMFLSGGRRTFTAPDGTPYAVKHYPHLIADYFEASRAAGLTLDALAEPYAEGMNAPAVLVLRLSN